MSAIASTPAKSEWVEQERRQLRTIDYIGMFLSAAVLIGGVAMVFYGLTLAVRWYNQPFLGALAYQTGSLIGTRSLTGAEWPGLQAGLSEDDILLRIDQTSLITADFPGALLNETLSALQVGDTVQVTVLRPARRLADNTPATCRNFTESGAECTFAVTLGRMPFTDFLGFFGLGFAVALAALALGGWLWWVRRENQAARILVHICVILAVLCIARFESTTTYRFSHLLIVSLVALGVLFLQLGMVFPYTLAAIRRQPWLRAGSILSGVAIAVIALTIFRPEQPSTIDSSVALALIYLFACTVFLVASMVGRRALSSSGLAREQASVVLITGIIVTIPGTLWFLTNLLERAKLVQGLTFSTIFLQPTFLIFPLGVAYALLQQRRINTDRLISESLVLGILGLMLVGGYLALTSAAYALTAGLIQPNNPLLIALTLFVIAVLFTPVRLRMERYVDNTFFRQRRVYERRLEQFARDLTGTIQSDDVVSILRRELDESLGPQYTFIFLRNTVTGDFEAVIDPETERPQTDIRFRPDSGLLSLLAETRGVLNLERESIPPAELRADRPRLAVLNTPVLVPLRSVRRLNGFLAMSARRDNGPYLHEDLRYLENLAGQAAAAFERAQVMLESQRNERELQVLVRVSTALNITMEFDTLLEFIFAQVDRVIYAPNFYIVLRDQKTDELSYALYQEDENRLPEKEGTRWAMGRDLLSEVIRTQQPLRTDNYVRDMQRRDSAARIENMSLRAWVGVPLNAGEGRTIGALAIASTDPNLTYTDDQVRIFTNIADLAATAIYKLRLLTEKTELARQMEVLNESSSRLATLFEDVDALLQTITESAVHILNCEAGSLLLVDKETGDLIFRLAIGGSGQGLVGRRVSAGRGIAGSVALTASPIIVNDPYHDPRWYGEMNAEETVSAPTSSTPGTGTPLTATPAAGNLGTGRLGSGRLGTGPLGNGPVGNGTNGGQAAAPFQTRSILAVPLSARNRVIGVLQVLNKRDGTGFDETNVNLLMTFAGQAAVAIENANLFRQTDEALTQRIQQLFNMQRIDQELNRTLDFLRVVDLTVDNAIRESEADAGVLLIVEDNHFRVVGSAGYPERILKTGDRFSLDHGVFARVYESSTPQFLEGPALVEGDYDLLPGTRSQISVPLVTGDTVTGVLVLETTHGSIFNTMTVEHIQSIAEHANTAITNARLFAQLDEANQARSHLMRTVAHELKQPMASIKGYSDVLLSGLQGSLSEKQQEYVSVVRRNAVRMQQLVDDLRDLTAHETGNLTLKLAAVNFQSVVLESVRPQQRAFDEKGQTLVLNVPDGLPPAYGDEGRLIQIMTNFLSNAHKYTPPGGRVTVEVAAMENRWEAHGAASVILCTVTDTGIGMDEEDLSNLFKPYWRSPNPLAQEQTGTGLGMSLTRGLIEAQGGRVWVESALGEGTRFSFYVPVA